MTDTIVIREDLPILVSLLGGQGPAGPQGEDGDSNISGLPISIPAVTTGGVVDNAAAINASLANSTHSITMLPAGVIGVGSTIRVPSGKTLMGAGAGRTTIKALASFDKDIDTNGVIASADGATDVRLCDFAIDVNKVGDGMGEAERIQGTMMNQTVGFQIDRVPVKNATGYAHFALGASKGVYRDSPVQNSVVHYEAMTCDGITYYDNHSSDGDGDMVCQSYLHPLTRSKNITYVNGKGKGDVASCVEITANEATGGQDNIKFIGCEYESLNGGIGFVTGGAQGNRRIQIIASRFASDAYLGANIEFASGEIIGSCISGVGTALAIDAQAGDYDWDISNSIALCEAEAAATGIGLLAEGGTNVRWSGGRIEVDTTAGGSSAAPISRGAGSTVTVSPETAIVPNGDVDGGGFTFKRKLPAGGASSSSTSGTIVVNGTDYEWTFPVKAGHTYYGEILNGAWIHASTASNGRLAVQGGGGAAGTMAGMLFLNTSTTSRTVKFINAILGVGNAGSQVEAAMGSISEYLPAGGSFVFECTADGTLSIEIGTSNASHGMSLAGLAVLKVEEI